MNARPRLLIPDASPLSLLASIGAEALDWLFVPGADVWVTDMVRDEANRAPDPGDDQRALQRNVVAAWFVHRSSRIAIQATPQGEEHARAMETWRLAGSPSALKPRGRGAGERSVISILEGIEANATDRRPIVVLMDDRKGRAAVRLVGHLDIDLMATESFLVWLAQAFGIARAATAWPTIMRATAGRAPSAPDEDPVLIRRG